MFARLHAREVKLGLHKSLTMLYYSLVYGFGDALHAGEEKRDMHA